MYRKRIDFPSWTKWVVLAFILLIIAFITFFVIVYTSIQSSKTDGYDAARKRVLAETDIVEINDTMRFYGDTGYHVIYGTKRDNEEQIAFVPDTKKEDITIVAQEDIITSDTVKQNWEKECSACEFQAIVPAIIKGNALWEITFTDEANRYVINYVSMYDGTQYEEFRFNKMFE
ncbi:cell wall elongation regulator TseB-like domain-containing protein [Ornithinibacillus contaminans]|uniref:cell wall elongation regulator TseB-like domain-containing protein n=1 Tax=Ornithinibacillus contaminans TaxID=694055 RepID=UPI00064DD70E|nr:DUF5590 domain-containing protein [Ornithinibacillus contaminans]